MRDQLVRLGRRVALSAAAAGYYLLFRLARRIAIPPAPDLTPDPPVRPDAMILLMALEAVRRGGWPH